ncbi:hypothetical protein EJ06DRAFT_12351 [Trichodelitschia bisporula]|uniref:Uncharacterized protein n=1 Tax=Trichodelitschia bisporula TaxID=703511 RepID=A0A6G1I9Z9_9PEZI|nr:hypothetical protein EJ06DRAFT_12351 [Trichodelitschia bisporula]
MGIAEWFRGCRPQAVVCVVLARHRHSPLVLANGMLASQSMGTSMAAFHHQLMACTSASPPGLLRWALGSVRQHASCARGCTEPAVVPVVATDGSGWVGCWRGDRELGIGRVIASWAVESHLAPVCVMPYSP